MKITLITSLILLTAISPLFGGKPARRGHIVHIEKGDIYIDLGAEDGMRPKDELEVYRQAKGELIHPVTGQKLGYIQKKIGKIRVKWVEEKFSIASILSCQPDEEFKIVDIVIPDYVRPQEAEPEYGGILRGAFIHEPLSLDPARAVLSSETTISSCLYDTLLRPGVDGELLPSLSQRWEVERDGQTFILYLEQGVKFHNGKTLVAEDVRYSLNRLLRSDRGFWVNQIKEITIIEIIRSISISLVLALFGTTIAILTGLISSRKITRSIQGAC